MSQLLVPKAARKPLAKCLNGESGFGVTLKLFKNNVTPTADTVEGDLTECDFGNYTAVGPTGWAVQANLDANNRAVLQANLVTFTKNGAPGNDVYGYWLENGDGDMIAVERFDNAPLTMQTDGEVIQFFPKMTVTSQF